MSFAGTRRWIVKLSKTATMAALAVSYLAKRRGEGHIQARQVAEYLGIIGSHLGRSGGYYLETEPKEVTLLQIVEAVEGPIEGDIPVESDGNGLAKPIDELKKACNRVAHSIRAELGRTSVADMADLDSKPVLATIEHGVAH